jgi:hypothetical protein
MHLVKIQNLHLKTFPILWMSEKLNNNQFLAVKCPRAVALCNDRFASSNKNTREICKLVKNLPKWENVYCTKTLITNKCTKRILSSIVTPSYMFLPCWVIFRENFFVIVTLRLHFIVRSTQSTAHSHSTVKCNPSVTVTKSYPWRWPSRVETSRSVLRLMIKLSLCICWWLVCLYNIVHGHGTH